MKIRNTLIPIGMIIFWSSVVAEDGSLAVQKRLLPGTSREMVTMYHCQDMGCSQVQATHCEHTKDSVYHFDKKM